MKKRFMLGCFVIVLAATRASAHHSAAVYTNATIVLKNATVRSLVWANPHTVLTFEVKDAKGAVATWNAESGSPSALTRMGWTRNSVKAGDPVTSSCSQRKTAPGSAAWPKSFAPTAASCATVKGPKAAWASRCPRALMIVDG